MKRLVLLVSALVLIVNILGGFSATHTFAQSPVMDPAQAAQAGIKLPTATAPTEIPCSPNVEPNDPETNAYNNCVPGSFTEPTSPANPKNNTSSCSLFWKSSITDCLSAGFQWIIKNIFLEIGGFMVWLTANMFNYSIRIGVLDFASWAPDSLYPIWLIIRQIVSLIIVFIGLYLGFMYILGKDGFQKYIPWVIMFALFVNFSYPLVRTAIDLSNVISLRIYVSAVGTSALDPATGSDAGGLIVKKLGLQGLAASAVSSKGGTGLVTSINSVPSALLAVCYVFYTAYIFFMVTALFVLRTAALVFLIVASPILLVDSVLPMLGERAKLVRKIFFEQLAIGPIFMLMLALTLKFLDVFATTGNLNASGLGAVANGDATISVFFNILMMLIMLWIMLKVTKSTAGTLGEYATNAMGTVGGFAVGAATGGVMAGTGMLARKGLGGAAMKLRDSKWVQNNQDSFLGRRAYNLSNSVASSTFDLRNTAVAQKYAGKLGISGGMGAGVKYGQEEFGKAKLKDAIERSSRIKTRYERDVIQEKVDADGKKVREVVHRKGDVDEAGVAAKNRFIANAGGGTMFLTKEQKQKQREALGAEDEKESDKRIADLSADSKKDIKIFNDINEEEVVRDRDTGEKYTISAQQSKARFLEMKKRELNELKKTDKGLVGNPAQTLLQSTQALDVQYYKDIEKDVLRDGTEVSKMEGKAKFIQDLENELETLRQSDPELDSNQAQSLMKSIATIKNIEKSEKVAFDKQVKNTFETYLRKAGNPQDQSRYLTDQTKEVHDAVKRMIEGNTVDIDLTQGNTGPTPQPTPVDIDLTEPNSNTRSQGQATASTSVQAQPQSNVVNSVIVDQNGRNFQYTVDPQTKAVNIVSPDAGAPFDVSTVNFSARMAGRNRPTSPVTGTPIPSPTATAPSAPAANESNAAQSA